MISNENKLSFTLFGTALNQGLRTSISNTNRMTSTVLNLSSDQLDDSFSVRNSTISQQENLFGITLNNLSLKDSEQWIVDFSTTHISPHSVDLFNCLIETFLFVLGALVEHEV